MQESRIQTQVCLSLFVSIFSGNFTDSRPLAGPWAKSSARQNSRSWIQWGTGLLGRLGRSPSGSGWPRASLGPGQAAGGPQVWGRAAAWPISKHIQSQPKGNPDSVSAGMPGAQALETLNIKCVGWLPSLVIKTLISYFTQDGQEGHGAVLRGFIAPLFTDEVALLRKTSLSSGTHTALFIKLFPGRAGSGGREVSQSVEPIQGSQQCLRLSTSPKCVCAPGSLQRAWPRAPHLCCNGSLGAGAGSGNGDREGVPRQVWKEDRRERGAFP